MRRTKRGGWPYSQPPNTPFELNKSSPLARGLQGWWPSLGSQGALILRGLALGANLDATGSPAWRAAATRGQVVRLDDTNADYYSGSRHPAMDITGDLDYEVALWFRVNAWAADWQAPVLCGTKPDIWGATNGWNINLYRSDALQYAQFGGHPGPSYCGSAATTSFSVGDWVLVHGWRQLSNDNAYIAFNDGAPLHNVWLGNPTDGTTIYVGSTTATNANLDWDFGDLMFWNRLLSATERQQLYRNSWELYRPIIRRWVGWKAPTPPAAIVPVAMHHYRSMRL